MNNVMLTRNGNIVNRKRNNSGTFPAWNSFIDELFKDEFDNVKNTDFNKGNTSPKVNIKETTDAFILEMAVPGFNKSDFVIDLENETLSISTEIKTEESETKDDYTRKEFGYASFKRSFILPDTVDRDKIEAAYTDGILGITIPKKEEAKPKPARSIEIS